jgi:hypothetical protein
MHRFTTKNSASLPMSFNSQRKGGDP